MLRDKITDKLEERNIPLYTLVMRHTCGKRNYYSQHSHTKEVGAGHYSMKYHLLCSPKCRTNRWCYYFAIDLAVTIEANDKEDLVHRANESQSDWKLELKTYVRKSTAENGDNGPQK